VSETSEWYERAARELAATSELQPAWARQVAEDPELLLLIDGLPREHRQPSLLFSVACWLGAPAVAGADWREWLIEHWPAVAHAARTRRTQTNEVGRCIPLLLGLDRIPGPIALLELGAAAGLCLAVDRYSYRFDEAEVLGDGSPLLATTTTGVGVAPTRMPDIVWRGGIDLHPLDISVPGDVSWLRALLPPDRPLRRARLDEAIVTVRALDPRESPRVVAGDAVDELPALAAAARADAPEATLVVAALGTLVYLGRERREAVVDAAFRLGAHLVTFEGAAVLPGVAERLRGVSAPHPTPFVLALDGEPLAHAGPHGDRVSWFSQDSAAGQPELPGAAA
jgi:hypothetical protein